MPVGLGACRGGSTRWTPSCCAYGSVVALVSEGLEKELGNPHPNRERHHPNSDSFAQRRHLGGANMGGLSPSFLLLFGH